jgi:TolB protein
MNAKAATKTSRYFRATLAALMALVMVASFLAPFAGPAKAAFPGQNGNIVFVRDRDGDSEIRKLSECLICKTRLTNNTAEDFAPSVSPDGNKISFVCDRDGNYEIYSMNSNGSNPTNVSEHSSADSYPNWGVRPQ